jgi:hypothetical protein
MWKIFMNLTEPLRGYAIFRVYGIKRGISHIPRFGDSIGYFIGDLGGHWAFLYIPV